MVDVVEKLSTIMDLCEKVANMLRIREAPKDARG